MKTPLQKVAIITGASQGIGSALVDAYRKLGYAVVANSRSITPADDQHVLTVQGDIADPATAERVVAAAIDRYGHVDTLVNNADARVPSVLAALTKGGLQYATKSLAIEYAARGIRTNAVSPGTTNTPMHPREAHDTLAALQPVGRLGELSDVVDAVMYLENASFVTGEILHVDGGMSAGH